MTGVDPMDGWFVKPSVKYPEHPRCDICGNQREYTIHFVARYSTQLSSICPICIGALVDVNTKHLAW